MGLFHFTNYPPTTALPAALNSFSKLLPHLGNPSFRVERIIFNHFSIARQFLARLAGTPWLAKNLDHPEPACGGACLPAIQKRIISTIVVQIKPPVIVCSVDTAYELHRLLNILGDSKSEAKIEILCADTPDAKNSLKYFLQDKLPELELPSGSQTPVRCSLVYQNYEIEVTVQKKKGSRKRTRKPPASFQNLLKAAAPDYYPFIVGNDYYGRPVFSTLINLEHQLNALGRDNQVPAPPSPVKYYDHFNTDNAIEFRFDADLSPGVFELWMACLNALLEDPLSPASDSIQQSSLVSLLRIVSHYESWNESLFGQGLTRGATSDQLLFTWNDIELASKQQNHDYLSQFRGNNGIPCGAAIYLQLTPPIDDPDFRATLIGEKIGLPLILR